MSDRRMLPALLVCLLAAACGSDESTQASPGDDAAGGQATSGGASGTGAAGAKGGQAGAGGQKAQAGSAGNGGSGNAGSSPTGGAGGAGGKGGSAGPGGAGGSGGSAGSGSAGGKGGSAGSGGAGSSGSGGGGSAGSTGVAGQGSAGKAGAAGSAGVGQGGSGGGGQACVDWVYMGSDPWACQGHLGSSCGWTPSNEGQGFHCQVLSWGVGCDAGGGGCSGGAAGAGAAGSNTGGSTGGPDPFHGYRVVGYLPDYDGDPKTVQYDKLTHINFAFATVNNDGSLNTATAMLQEVVTKAHAANVKVLISVGGGDADIAAVMKNDGKRATVIKGIEDLVTTYHLDGVDVDWEGFDASAASAYTALMAALHGKLSPSGKLVTTALDTGTWFGMNVPTDSFPYIDQLNIMAYDGDAPHSPYELAANGIKYWTGRGYPKAKINIGVPFYGRMNTDWNKEISYKALVAKDPAAAYLDAYGGYNYNGIPTIQKKTQLAMQQVGGIMIWELAQDASGPNSLLSAIYGQLSTP